MTTSKHKTADDAVMGFLFPGDASLKRIEARKNALLFRNALITIIEQERERTKVSKKALAEDADIEYASLRRLLTSDDANPTLDTLARLLAATQMRMKLIAESGEEFEIGPERITA